MITPWERIVSDAITFSITWRGSGKWIVRRSKWNARLCCRVRDENSLETLSLRTQNPNSLRWMPDGLLQPTVPEAEIATFPESLVGICTGCSSSQLPTIFRMSPY
jgi:hypothetical protein